MTSPDWNNTQLAFHLKELGAVPGTTRGNAVSGIGWWEYYPGATSDYAGLSTATNTDNQPAADTTAGNVVADAGFGGM